MNNEYLAIFLEESSDHLTALNENVLLLEKEPTNIGVVGEIFRSAHTFKGMSATMGFTDIAQLTHTMENVLDLIRNHKLSVTEEVIDIILQCIDNLETMVSDIQRGGSGSLDVVDTIEKLEMLLNGGQTETTVEPETVSGVAPKKNEEVERITTSYTSDSGTLYNAGEISLALDLVNELATHKVRIVLKDDCSMKAVRVYMVFDALSKVSQVISSNPPREELDKENFESSFDIFISTEENEKAITDLIDAISEIHECSIFKIIEDEKQAEPVLEDLKEVIAESQKSVPSAKKTNTANSSVRSNKIESKSIRVNIEKIEHLMNMFEESVIERGRIEELATQINHPELQEHIQRLGSISKDLQGLVLNMRMVPIDTVFNRFPKTVRQLSKNLGKHIEFTISGEDTELDRMVIDEIGDPLIHLIRNSVDHGIELPSVREERGKDPMGKIHLAAFQSGNNVVIEITDNGNGINKEKVLKKAIEKGIVPKSNSTSLTPNEINELILAPGFSTADTISDISGRGVGLDVVRTTIAKLGGKINIKSEEGIGSTFRIELPLTLSIIQSMLFGVGNAKYAIPIANIIETMNIPKSIIQVINQKNVMNYREKTIQIISLKEMFGMNIRENEEQDYYQVIVLKNSERELAIIVDEIFGQREIVLKTLGKFFTDGPTFFSGATILGDGTVSLIIDCDTIK